MKYAEYQVWFHAFNNAYTALCNFRNPTGGKLSFDEIRIEAERVANLALKKFEEVKMPEAPDMSGIDLQGLVNKVAQDVTRTKTG